MSINLKELVKQNAEKIMNEYNFFNKETKMYEDEIYLDYRDRGDLERHVYDFMRDKENITMDSAYENLWELFEEYSFETRYSMFSEIKEAVIHNIEDIGLEEDTYNDIAIEEAVNDWLDNNYIIKYPEEDYFNTTVNLNIILDTGDGNYEFTLNSFNEYYDGDERVFEKESSLLWLINQQGYTEEQLQEAYELNNSFLKSIENEMENVTTSMNALTFFVNMTFKDYINLKEKIAENKEYIIKIPKKAECGLVDYWHGAGSLLSIELEKPVEIPAKYIWTINLDDNIGSYGVGEIYGDDSMWSAELVINA